jgi:hypothetical protein
MDQEVFDALMKFTEFGPLLCRGYELAVLRNSGLVVRTMFQGNPEWRLSDAAAAIVELRGLEE